MKNSLKNFQEEIDKLKNNNNSNNIKNYSNDNLELKNISMRNIFKTKKIDDNHNNKCNDALYNKNNNKDNKNNIILSLNKCFDPLSITFNSQFPNSEEKGNNSNDYILYNCNEFSPTWKKSSEI